MFHYTNFTEFLVTLVLQKIFRLIFLVLLAFRHYKHFILKQQVLQGLVALRVCVRGRCRAGVQGEQMNQSKLLHFFIAYGSFP